MYFRLLLSIFPSVNVNLFLHSVFLSGGGTMRSLVSHFLCFGQNDFTNVAGGSLGSSSVDDNITVQTQNLLI